VTPEAILGPDNMGFLYYMFVGSSIVEIPGTVNPKSAIFQAFLLEERALELDFRTLEDGNSVDLNPDGSWRS